jgi:anti-sigma regulatory factor (Ser/Thr protein kinase)
MTHLHQLVLAGSDDDVVAAVVPFVLAGRAAGEPMLLSTPPRTAAAVRDLVGPWPGLTVLPDDPGSRRPGTDLARFAALVRECMAAGTQVRVVNQVPPRLYRNWHEWRRYEAIVNVVHAGLDAWGLCVYDERRLSPAMVDDLRSTHPFVGHGVDRRTNPDYEDPRAFCDAHFDAAPDPVEQAAPALQLLDASAATARAAVRDIGFGQARLTGDEVESLVLATHEAVTNAAVHGRPPVTLRAWVAPGRVVVTVTDVGPGPGDPFLGLRYSLDRQGMWLCHQLVDVAHRRHAEGYTIRLTVSGSVAPLPSPRRTEHDRRR